jgi:hypothetical protein
VLVNQTVYAVTSVAFDDQPRRKHSQHVTSNSITGIRPKNARRAKSAATAAPPLPVRMNQRATVVLMGMTATIEVRTVDLSLTREMMEMLAKAIAS